MRDYFNGKIKNPKELFIGLMAYALILFSMAVFFLMIALFYENTDYSTRVLLIVFSIVSFVVSIGYPIITIHVLKNKEKYPRLAKLLVKPDQFIEYKGENMFGKHINRKKRIPFEVQLENLKEIGIYLNSDIENEDIFQLIERKEIERNSYIDLLIAMGNEIEKTDDIWIPISNDVWYFDTECIEDSGIYVEIMDRLMRLTQGYLKFDNIEDYIEIENNKAWVSFYFKDNYYKWDLEVEDDWFDFTLIQRLNEFLGDYAYNKKFAVAVLDQTCLICFLGPKQLEKINLLSGLKFEYE